MNRFLRPGLLAATLSLSGCFIPLGDTKATPAVVPVGAPVAANTSGMTLSGPTIPTELNVNEERVLFNLLKDQAGAQPAPGAVTWSSSNPTVMSIHPQTGQAKGISAGTAIVVATLAANPAVRTQFEVKVVSRGAVVSVDPANPTLALGEQVTLRASVALANGTINQNVNWTSSDETVATVNPTTGVVNPLREGRVTIRATYAQDDQYFGVSSVTIVKDKSAVPSSQPSSIVFGPGETGTDPGTPAGTGQAGAPGRFVFQDSGTTATLEAVDFVDARLGYVAGASGTVLKTVDGGASWDVVSPGALVNQEITGIHFADADLGVLSTAQGLWRTTDGGATWTAVDLGSADSITRVQFADDKIGYVYPFVTGRPYFYKTTDGGANWSKVNVPGTNLVVEVARVGGTDVVLADSGVYTYDSGAGGWASRQAAGVGSTQYGRTAALAADGSTTWLCQGGTMLKSPDKGLTWTNLGSLKGGDGNAISAPGQLRDFLFPGGGAAFIVSNGGVLTSGDGGATWANATDLSASGNGLYDADFVNGQNGWIVGDQGKIIRYSAR